MGGVVSLAGEAEAFVWAGLEIITCYDEETTAALLVPRLNHKYYEETVYFAVVGALSFS